jgi:hypothetical protein
VFLTGFIASLPKDNVYAARFLLGWVGIVTCRRGGV